MGSRRTAHLWYTCRSIVIPSGQGSIRTVQDSPRQELTLHLTIATGIGAGYLAQEIALRVPAGQLSASDLATMGGAAYLASHLFVIPKRKENPRTAATLS